MRSPGRTLPGGGFLFLAVVAGLSVGAVLWGLQTPPLDRVWQMQLELRLGERTLLSAPEQSLLQETLASYPLLAEHMLEDAACGLITANVDGVVDGGVAYAIQRRAGGLTVTSHSGELITVVASSVGDTRRGTADGEDFVWQPPTDGPFPRLLEVRLARSGKKPGTPAMHIELECSP